MGHPTITLKTRLFVYISHFLSAWGDRMWQFGIGLFLIELEPDSLQLVAIYGFISGAMTLLFSTVIGDWVDRTARLKAARLSLATQNIFVAVCAGVVFVVHKYLDEIKAEWEDEWLLTLCFAIIILLGICADLASVANTIVIERDWVVELCQHDTDLLGSMTATLRSIDLTTKLAAPIVTGQVIYFLHIGWGGVFIASWNVVSLFVEYNMIKKVYDQIPSLADQKFKEGLDSAEETTDETSPLIGNDSSKGVKYNQDDKSVTIEDGQSEYTYGSNENQNGGPSKEKDVGIDIEDELPKKNKAEDKKPKSWCYTVFYSFIVLYKGWRIFMSYKVAFAGLGLATLYMTVLGFDNITVGYAYSQGISESLLGIFMAVGSLFGITGTFAYPLFRKHLGLKSTGLTGMVFQITCLSACVVSIFLPGSPFDLLHRLNDDDSSIINGTEASTVTIPTSASTELFTLNTSVSVSDPTTIIFQNTTRAAENDSDEPDSYLSIGFFLGGLIVARFGLWIADLSITQLFLQTVKEKERGLVSGVQNSLNQLMDMLKALMVILAPYPEEFGLLTILSFAFVCMGCLLYIKFVCSNRGISYG
ncbi:solute carrier family 40 member 1-like [Mytilus californianus]|uniref:solute carrier family 40 member 1-like n=1 Tax=Mytilus californianus TaxID=6549 RepID=UPI002245D00A|nr:solute carrier family 40 member 1-like [Mytilus californianus]